MVEMLFSAFILAIGILGLSMLQAMSLKASRGGQSMNNAVQVADRMMDQIEAEGRLSWLSVTDTPLLVPETLADLQYVGKATRYLAFQETYDAANNVYKVEPATNAPVASKPALSATTRYVATCTVANTVNNGAGSGKVSDYNIVVEFADDTTQAGASVVRTVNISRRIIHG